MKTRVFLILSLLVNLAFAALTLVSPKTVPESAKGPDTANPPIPAASGVSNPKRETVTATSTAGFNWAQVESSDYKQYIANLRAIGCPELTIQEIIIADIDKLYAPREKSLRVRSDDALNYWEPKTLKSITTDTDSRLKLLALKKEKNEVIYELLHVSLPIYGENERQLYGSDPKKVLATVPEEKRNLVASITQKYDLMAQEMSEKGLYTPEDNRHMNQIRKARLAELEAALGVPGARDYYAQTSWLNRELRSQLAGFNPTEAEYRAIHDSKERFDFNYGNMGHYDQGDVEGINRFQQGVRETSQKLQETLGPERYAEYQRTFDGSYQSLVRLVGAYDLPGGTAAANTVYAVKTEAQRMRNQIYTNPGISPAERAQAMEQLRADVETKVKNSLGDDVFSKYRSQAGSWMNQLR